MKKLILLLFPLIFIACFFHKSPSPELLSDDMRPAWAENILKQHHPSNNPNADYSILENTYEADYNKNTIKLTWYENEKEFIYQEGPSQLLVDVIIFYKEQGLYPDENDQPEIINGKYYLLLIGR